MRVEGQAINSNCRSRSSILCLTFMVGFTIILARLFYLQVTLADDRADRVRKQHQIAIMLEANRGLIFDKNGKSLALNLEVPSLYALPRSIKNPDQTAQTLAAILDIPAPTLTKRLKKDQYFVWIKRKLEPELAQAVLSLSLPGVNALMETRRFYPKEHLLSNLMGFAGMDSQGLEGLELQYDSSLRGQKGLVHGQRDGLGRVMFPGGLQDQQPPAGHRITLSVDEVAQYIAEQELEMAMTRTKARIGTILVMDPNTGAIIAWALRPTFDPNHSRHLSPALWRNRAITDPFEPGSTLKVVVAGGALEEGVMTPETKIYGGEGVMTVAGTLIHDPAKSGWMSFSEVLAHSSNIGAIKIAMDLGKDRLYRYLRGFGFGEKTGIDLPGESVGILKKPQHWGARTLASVAIGQEIAVTPLQLLTAMSVVANGGWLLNPFVVSEIQDAQGNSIFKRTPQVIGRPISQKTAQTLTSLLKMAVQEGTGKRAQLLGYPVAGKTGTAQKIDQETGKYSSTKSIASFVGFVPADNPLLAILVILDEPQGEAWGGVVAAPVFRQVATRMLRYMEVAPDKAKVIKTSLSITKIPRHRGQGSVVYEH